MSGGISGSDCTCGAKFRDAEDWRDHLPCEGTVEDRLRHKVSALSGWIEEVVVNGNFDDEADLIDQAREILAQCR